MTFNWLVIPTLAATLLLFWLGWMLSSRVKSPRAVACVYALGATLSLPGLLFALYYFHLYDLWRLFYEFRAVPGSELTAAGTGLLAGLLAHRAASLGRLHALVRTAILMVLCLGIVMPYAKPFIAPADYANFRDEWEGTVCKQSTGYSCGAACAATMLRLHDIPATELEIAKECFTYGSGTENWYLARALRKRGLRVTFVTERDVSGELPVPCIAGIKMGQVGHFITILGKRGNMYLVGDPLAGEHHFDKATITRDFHFTGFFMKVEKTGKTSVQSTRKDNLP